MPPDEMTPAALPRVALTYGGKTLRFEPADPSVTFTLHGVHSRFVVPTDTPVDCVVHCAFGEPEPAVADLLYEGQDVWDLRRLPSGAEQVCYYSATGGGGRIPWAILTLEPTFDRATIVQRPLWGGDVAMRVGFPFDEYLMCRLLAREGSFIVHGAAVEYGGLGLLFAGHSGAGKSTMSEIAERAGARILSDDRTIVTVHEGTPRIWGTPWHGSHRKGSAAGVALDGLYLLMQAREDKVVRVPPGRALGEIFVRSILPTVDADETAKVLGGAERLVMLMPVDELQFRPSADAFFLAIENVRCRSVA